MNHDRLPAHRVGGGPVKPPNSGAAPLARAGQMQGTYQPGKLDFGENFVSREDAWQNLGTKLRQKVDSRLGSLVEWWAQDIRGRTSAVVLGTRALITVTPTVNASGQPAHELRAFPIGGEHTFRTASVAEQTAGRAAGAGRVAGAGSQRIEPGRPVPDSTSTLTQRLGSDMVGFLGNLPVKAQQLLLEPFVASPDELWSDYYYVRHRLGGENGPVELEVWAYLADRATVTFVSGMGHGHGDLSGPIRWDLTCRRAAVTKNADTG